MDAKVRKPRNSKKNSADQQAQAKSLERMAITRRLDDAIPLNTDEWQKVEQMLMRLTEFAPTDLIMEVASAVAFYADDQARRGYILGAADSCKLVA